VFNINIWYLLSLNMVLYGCGLGYVPFVVVILRSFHHLWLINWFVTRLTRLMAHVGAGTAFLSGAHRILMIFVLLDL